MAAQRSPVRARVSNAGRRIARAISVLALVALSTISAPAVADGDEEGRRLFEAGKTSFDAGSFDEALRLFEESFERSQRPELQYNIGLAADRLRQDDKALSAFRYYLTKVPDATNRAEVEARIRALERAHAEHQAVPTPEIVAAGSDAATPKSGGDAIDGRKDQGDAQPIIKRWWFWTAIGAAVAAGVIVGVVVAGGEGDGAEPFESRSGLDVMALTRR